MKVLIEIPENAYEWINEHKGVTDFKTTEMLYNRIRNGIPLNGTNGDVLMAVYECETIDVFHKSYGIKIDNSNYFQLNKDWWNADYKGVE